VREGTANAAELSLEKARINIGRVVDVYRDAGLYRRNDLAFAADTDDQPLGFARARPHPARPRERRVSPL
jgi:hypothetical protein